MHSLRGPHSPLIGLGMTSLVLGVIAMILGFLPILGLPISSFGLFFGILGAIAGLFLGIGSLRYSLGGIAASCLALSINLAILYAPGGYLPGRHVPRLWQRVPDRPAVSPPATSKWFD